MGSEVDDNIMMAHGSGKSVVIFVFSNGQQDSPPRKYSLRVGERWDTTMNFLARSQYGSKQTVDLYTVEGKKIEGPLELRDGAAYVAVEPPQPFAPAGYHEYLMKASRSREKRQERITDKASSIKTVKLNIKDKNEEDHKDATTIDNVTIVSADAILAEEQHAITDKFKSDIVRVVRPIRRISTFKQPQKKNRCLAQPSSTIIRKNINNVTATARKTNNTSRVDALRQKFETSSMKSTKTTNASAVGSKPKNEKPSGLRPAYNREHAVSDIQRKTDFSSIPHKTFADSSTSTTSAVIEQILRVLPVSVEDGKDLRESELSNTNEQFLNAGTFHDSKSNVGILSKDEGNARTTTNSNGNPQDGASNVKFTTEVLDEISQNETLICGNQTGNNNFAIYIKKGDKINLKLNIEVKNGSTAVIEKKHSHHLIETVSVTSAHKSDRGTLANNSAVANSGRDIPGSSESYLGGLPFEQLQQMTNDLKLAVCGVNCCPCPRVPERAAPVYVDNNNYIILLPPDTQHTNSASCTCKLDTSQKSTSEISDCQVLLKSKSAVTLEEEKNDGTVVTEKRISVTSLSKNICSDETAVTENSKSVTSLSKNTCNGVTVVSEKRNSVPSLSKNVSKVEIEVNQICECCETCQILNLPPACDCTETVLECPKCERDPPIPTDLVVKQHPLVNSNGNTYKEAFTQTVWTCVVLEARPCVDGSYAFHLPSLEILKLCNVLY